MSEFKIGCDVVANNGRLGRLAQVVIDRHTGEVTDLVVELQGGDVKVVVPRSAVSRYDDQAINVDMLMEDLPKLPIYQAAEFEACEPAQSGRPAGQAVRWLRRYGAQSGGRPAIAAAVKDRLAARWPKVGKAIGRGTRVSLQGKEVTEIDHVLVNGGTGEITHVVLGRTEAGGSWPVVPAEAVESSEEGELSVSLTPGEWQSLAHYAPRPDSAIATEVRERLEAVGVAPGDLDVTVTQGVVEVHGSAYDLETKRAADKAMREIEGVVAVDNRLTVDSGVAAEITAALLRDPRTSLRTIEVIVNHGTVTLQGTVASRAEAEAAEEIARGVEGVHVVINELRVDPEMKSGPDLTLMIHPLQWLPPYNR